MNYNPDKYIAELDASNPHESQATQSGTLWVQFYKRPKQNAEKSAAEGRAIYEMVDYIKIRAPGDKTFEIDRPVRPLDKRQHPHAWAAFINDRDQEADGTPLSAWGMLDPARCEEYAYLKIKTVEQLANVADSNLVSMGPNGRKDRDRAKAFLEATKGTAPVMKLQAELEEKDKRLAALEAQMAALLNVRQAVDAIPGDGGDPVLTEAPAPKKRGRPAKVKAETPPAEG